MTTRFPGPLIGMVHLAALPGSPHASLRVERIARAAAAEAKVLEDAGFDAVLVENMHDLPYLRRRVGPEVVAAMAACTLCVRAAVSVPVGVRQASRWTNANCVKCARPRACRCWSDPAPPARRPPGCSRWPTP
jgi:predicted TIM-barrel enzyme